MAARLSLFYATVFLSVGVLLPFWPVWLQGHGMGATEIGIILATAQWVRAFTNPLIAQFADRSGRPDRIAAAAAWVAFAAYGLFAAADGFPQLLAVSVIAGIASGAVLPLGDSVTMLKVREGSVDYGRVRLWGSLAFILASTGGGAVLSGRPTEAILWLVIGCFALQLGATHALPVARTGGKARFGAPLIATARDRPFLGFLVAASLLQASHGVYYGFATLHWRAAGFGATAIGALWAEGVAAEIALFWASKAVFRRMPPLAWLGIAAIGGVVRWTALGLTTAPGPVAAAQLLHALTFGAAHLAAMHHIARTVPPAHGATAQSLYSSVGGLAMALSTLASGWLYARFGGFAFLAMAGLSAAGGLAVAGLWRRR